VGYDVASETIGISVADHGCGIAQEKLPFLGRPFDQADSAFARKQGTGLGLAMVKALTSRLGGEFDVGTTVTIDLPAIHLAGMSGTGRKNPEGIRRPLEREALNANI
jgi:signal transduction histidine kinase